MRFNASSRAAMPSEWRKCACGTGPWHAVSAPPSVTACLGDKNADKSGKDWRHTHGSVHVSGQMKEPILDKPCCCGWDQVQLDSSRIMQHDSVACEQQCSAALKGAWPFEGIAAHLKALKSTWTDRSAVPGWSSRSTNAWRRMARALACICRASL